MRRISELRRRLAEDSGSIIVEYVWLAILMLVPLVYLVLCVARVQAGSYAVSQAARESSRVFIASDDGATAGTRAQAAAAIAFEDQGFGGAGRVDITCSARPCLTPEQTVTSRATVSVPLPFVPGFVRGVVPLSMPVSAEQVVVVPRYGGGG